LKNWLSNLFIDMFVLPLSIFIGFVGLLGRFLIAAAGHGGLCSYGEYQQAQRFIKNILLNPTVKGVVSP
jgi:hypothetical protein